jgi:hypothetical protein
MTGLFPFIAIGLFAGSVYALAAMGLVLTYKTSGIFNFAYGAIAMFCGFTFWQLRDGWHITIKLPSPLPTIGPGLPPLTEQVALLLGEAHAAVSASLAPSFGAFVPSASPSPSPSPSPDSGSPTTTTTTTETLSPGGPGASAPAALALAPSPLSGSSGAPQIAAGPPIRAARSGVILGVPPGVAQLLLAVLAVLGGAMVLLTYARWQLLTGRSRVR